MNAAPERFFLDTNVLIYWVDPRAGGKHQLATQWVAGLWELGVGRLSWQVLNEFYTTALRKVGAKSGDARIVVETLAEWQPVSFSMGLLRRAWHWMDQAGVPYWDSLIVAAAELADCRYLLSEDFQAGQKFGEVTIVDPFRIDPEAFGLTTKGRG